jgi:hypothetical protein
MNGVTRTSSHHRLRRNDFFFGVAPRVEGVVPALPAGLILAEALLPVDAAAFPAFPVDGGRLETCLGVYRSPLEADVRSRDTVARC